ncbi:hypothetical protein KAI32_01640 [Candidatus Pacearchaeota archaeon]|nr:hypothetical protein [Candidatus Pacearchaeota archaeon]
MGEQEVVYSEINKKNSSYIFVIIFAVILLILAVIMFTTYLPLSKSQTTPDIDYKESQYTLSEIMEHGKEKGFEFCNELGREDLKKDCIESYLLNKAKEELNASICKESNDENFVQRCQYDTIFPEVAKKYNEEIISKNDTEIIPSNIGLCDQIDDEELKVLCLNPKIAIEEDYHLLD